MTRLSRADWFPIAARLLVSDGADALTIERLCSVVGVSKGSFYHHFGGMPGFRRDFLIYLVERGVGRALELVTSVESPSDRLRTLIDLIADEDLPLDRAVRCWALADAAAAAAVAQVDKRRHEIVTDIYRGLFPNDAALATDITRLAEAFYLGAVMSEPQVAGDEYRRLAGLLSTMSVVAVTRS